jgi:hypothetical protein
MALNVDLPSGLRNTTMVDPPEGSNQNYAYLISRVWSQWLQQQIINRIDNVPQRLQTVPLTSQTAAIVSTPFTLGTVSSGLYRISYFVRITTVAATSSSVTLNIGFTIGGIAQTVSSAALTGNTTTSVLDGPPFVIRSDQAAPITYSTTYASVPANAMAYSLDLIVEQIG